MISQHSYTFVLAVMIVGESFFVIVCSFVAWLQTSELLPMSQICLVIEKGLVSCPLMAVMLQL